jgi:beta-N-acetylhexosaminidase
MNSNINRLLAGMSLREKIGQTSQAQLSQVLSRASGDLSGYLARFPVGSLFAGKEIIGGAEVNATMMRDLLGDCQIASTIPLAVAGDLESGAGSAVYGLNEFPNQMALGAADSVDLAYEYGRLTATEARQVGFHWTFAPVADLSLNWLNPIVGTRSLGDRPNKIIPLLQALIRGYQDHGLAATAKHFPGDGVDFRDQHLCLSINSLDEATWRDSYGRVFSAVIDAGVQSIMPGHIALPWRDGRRGKGGRFIPATVSGQLLTSLLREEMRFQGVIVSDALIMAGITQWAPRRERMIAAFNAGIDVMLWPGEDYFDIMTAAVEFGEVSLERLDQSVRRILEFKTTLGLFKTAEDTAVRDRDSVFVSSEARDFSSTLAASGLTLVRNRKELLPLQVEKTRSVLILYATANVAAAKGRVAPLVDKLEARGIRVRVLFNGNCLDVVKMEEEGDRFDAFLCLFQQQAHNLKNTMRPTGEMAECLWTLQNTETLEPIVISLGGPHLLNDMPYADTLVNAYSSCVSVMEALDKALFGEARFPGKSPVQTGGEWIPCQQLLDSTSLRDFQPEALETL